MIEDLTNARFDSESTDSRFVSNGVLEEAANLIGHSWQAWSVLRENFLAGRKDLKARKVHLATFPNFPPTMGEIKARALRGESEYVMLEHYAGLVGEKKRRVNEDTRLIDFSSNGDHDFSGRSIENDDSGQSSNNPVQALNATAESIRAARELLRELAPAEQPNQVISRDEISVMINQTLTDLLAQQKAKPEENSEISRLRELMEFQRELQAQTTPQSSEPEISERDRTLLTLMKETGIAQEFFRAMRELIATPEQAVEPESWRDKLMQVASQNPQIVERVSATLERIVARILPPARTISAAAASRPSMTSALPNPIPSQAPDVPNASTPPQSAAPASPAPPTEQNEREHEDLTLDDFIIGIKEDIQQGNDPAEAVADALTLMTEHPEHGPIILALLQKSNQELLALLHQATGARLDCLSNACEYLDGFRDGVRDRLETPDKNASLKK
jgi:hypothetical protein